MRFFKWPVTEGEDAFAVDTATEFSPKIGDTSYTGDNPQRTLFGHYDWDAMPTYSLSASDTGAEEIGKLVHDVAFSLGSRMVFNPDGSGTAGYFLAPTFKNYFNYSGARYFSSETRNFPNLFSTYMKTIKSNLDAGKPVIVSVERTDAGHEIVIDGYGYGKDDGLFYIHANLGWNGTANGWYNMTDSSLTIDASDNCIYTSMSSIVFNIFPETYNDTYTIVSGRVTDGDGAPVEDATVSATYNKTTYTATTGENGIYALVLPTDKPVSTSSNPTLIDLKARSYTIAASKDGWTSSSETQPVARNICADDGLLFNQDNDVYMNNVADRDFTLKKYFETPVITVDDGVNVIVEGQSKTVTLSAPDADEILACTGVIPKLFYTTDGTTPTESSSFVYDGGTVTISSDCTLKVMTFTPGSSVYANSASVNMASATFAVVEADGNLILNGNFEQSTSATGGTRAGASGYANPWWTSPNDNVILAKPLAGSTWVQAVSQYDMKAAILQTSGSRTSAQLAHEAFVVPASGVYRFQFDYSARNSTKWGVYVPAVTTDFTIATSEGKKVLEGRVTPESASPATYIASVELAAGTYTLAFNQAMYVNTDSGEAEDKANVLDNIVLQRATPAPAPEISTAEGANNFFSSSAEATVSSSLYGAEIYYTFSPTDEAPADPTTASKLYSGPIAVSAMTNIVKAIVTAPGYLTSPVATATIVKTSITGENLVQGATAIGGTSLPSSTSFEAHSGATYGITFTYTGTEGDEAEVIATAADGTELTVATIEAGADEQEYSCTINIPVEGAYTLSVRATGSGTSSVALGDLEVLIASNTANSRKFWIVENKVSHNATGSWSPATEYSNGKIYFDDSAIAYTASRAASTRYVTIRTKMNFLARNDTASTDAPPADTKAAMRISDANNSFELYTKVEGAPAWVAVAAEGITPDPSVDYSLVFRLNTRAKTYTVAVLDALGNEIPFANGTQTRFPFACDSASAVTSVTFDCSGSVESIYGSDTPNGKGAFIELK